MPVVTIAIPTFNGANFLTECVESVLSQSLRDIEVLILDDCSTDSTLAITRQFADRDSRIRLLSNDQNLGLVGNWNRCLELAKGEWIKLVFQDDVLRPRCVELMLQSASRPIVFCKRNFLFEDGTDTEVINVYESIPGIEELAEGATDIDSELTQNLVLRESRNFFGEPTAALLHRSLFTRFGRFNEDLAHYCDLEYWIRVATNTGLAYVPTSLASFRYHAGGTSAGNRDPLKVERVNVFDRLIMLHEYAYNPHFASLRRSAAHGDPPRFFRKELARTACWIKARAQVLAASPDVPDTTWMLRWEQLIERYPKIGWSIWHMPHQARRWVDNQIGWRLRSH